MCRPLLQSLFWWKYCDTQSFNLNLDQEKYLFQSLFWWKYCPGEREGGYVDNPVEFQSLFWWKYCPGRSKPASSKNDISCFNPCSGGSIALGLGGAPLALLAVVSILVLVEVLPWERWTGLAQHLRTSFNPCSGGSIALGTLHVWAICKAR